MKEYSLVIIKPGFLNFENEIVKRLKQVGNIAKRKQTLLSPEILAEHYHEHVGKSFYEELVKYMSSGEVILFQMEGNEGMVANIRALAGSTKNPAEGTIRHDFGIGEITRNVVHSSDSPENGKEECERMFGKIKIKK